MTLRLRHARVNVHPLLPLVLLLSGLLNGWHTMLGSLMAFIVHETGHILTAQFWGQEVSLVEFTPFGAVMALKEGKGTKPLSAFLIAAAGPAFSLLGFAASPFLIRSPWVPLSLALSFGRFSLMLFVINLLPVLPLDGGRMLETILARFFPDQAVRRLLTRAGFAVSLFLIGLSFWFAVQGKLNLSPCFAGFYLLYASERERRQLGAAYLTNLIARRQKIREGVILPVEWIAVSGNASLQSLLPRLSPGKYHMFIPLSPDGMTALGWLHERQYCNALMQNGEQSLESCLPNGNLFK